MFIVSFMQKPKNLLPGLFLCVFSRIAEPLVDFYCSNLLVFPLFLFGADFFCRKERGFRPLLYRPFLYRPILRATPIKHTVLFCAIRPPKSPPLWHAPNRLKTTLLGLCTANLALFAHPKIPNVKAPHTPRLYSAALFDTHRPHERAPMQKPGEGAGAPQKSHAKTPGVSPGVWLMKNSFNLLLTHCGRFLAGCTGPACSRRPQ